jgi:hypothetical protein
VCASAAEAGDQPEFKERTMKNKPAPDGLSGLTDRPVRTQSPAYQAPDWRTTWLRCLEAAASQWNKIPYNDLAISGGEPRRLTHLVDKHYDLADGEARRQVEAFLRECQPRF